MTSKTKPTPRYPHRPTNLRPQKHTPEAEADDQTGSNAVDPELEEEPELILDPDESQVVVEGLSELDVEEPLELDRAELAAEMSEDPVRLYLREIGSVKLLDASREFRLAAMLEGRRVVLLTMRRRRMGKQDHDSPTKAAFHSLLSDLLIDWTRLAAGRGAESAPGLGEHHSILFTQLYGTRIVGSGPGLGQPGGSRLRRICDFLHPARAIC